MLPLLSHRSKWVRRLTVAMGVDRHENAGNRNSVSNPDSGLGFPLDFHSTKHLAEAQLFVS